MPPQRRRAFARLLLAPLVLGLLLTGPASGAGRPRYSLKDLPLLLGQQAPAPTPALGQCSFERPCDWAWNATGAPFRLSRPAQLAEKLAPATDAGRNANGKFLWLTGPNVGQLTSEVITGAGPDCYLELAIYQVEMRKGIISLIIEIYNSTRYVAAERVGNDSATWELTKFNVGGISQDFSIILELYLPYANQSIGIDNVKLTNCFPESRTFSHGECTNMFRCSDGLCLKRQHVCDLTADCTNGEDETGECDKVPEYARCNFESGWCGWENEKQRAFNWTLYKVSESSTATERRGPENDHTYRNSSGTYAYMDTVKKGAAYGSRGTLKSPIFNPPPPYHRTSGNPYYESCKVRFFYYQHVSNAALGLYLVQLKPHQNHTQQLWWSYKANLISGSWNSQMVVLPKDVLYKYYLQFEASKAYTSNSNIAIDDISLSPECFGIGVPADILGDFNYYEQKIPPLNLPKHADFSNKTIIQIGTCGQTGRIGPTPEQCSAHHNRSDVEVLTGSPANDGSAMLRFNGIQRWVVPRGGYYTLIAMGARGGAGALSMGVTLGAMVRGVVELVKGQQLYFMIGQPGTNACPKSLESKNDTCHQAGASNFTRDFVRQVKKTVLKDGGGGGGGATYIFTLKASGEQEPLMIAGGGGGLGPTQFKDDGVQHAKGPLPKERNAVDGESSSANAGGGGGWLPSTSNETSQVASGMALSKGGVGGVGCGAKHRGHGDGGFGGGGGGCLSGGGGGGYAGGVTGHSQSGNGEGGYSYVAPDLLHAGYIDKANAGPGEAFVIPAISGCSCDYRCVVVDQHLSETRCLCPSGWQLASDSKSCIKPNKSDVTHKTFMIILIIVSIVLLCAFSGLCLLLYYRYQTRKALMKRRQVMFGNGTELTSLRVVSDNMMTEFNPNYEFAGNLYSFKDLPQIPRDSIALVKPLGQGAFGEVFQGIYKYQRNEEHPVAVKTLPSLSTPQAEADFVMEALIMSKFNHPNIVHFIGVSFDKHPRYIVLELLAGGDLKNFLREERPRPDRTTILTMRDMIMCAYDVAKGCKYMEDARFIHRDIAARNCLLTGKGPGRVVKIADFGMARDIYRSDYYRKGGMAMLPIKWMPPESFLDGIFTTKTDVWAFGVLLWEIMSFGYMPYTGCTNREVMSMVTSGGRLEKPAGCPDPIYGIMTRCWHPHPEERPNFSTIVERIDYCLQDPDVVQQPTPHYNLLPICERENTIMRPDPETECINVQSDLDGCAYMQPRRSFRQQLYCGQPPVIVYASLKHSSEDRENFNNHHMDSYQSDDSPPLYHRHAGVSEDHDLDDHCDNKFSSQDNHQHQPTIDDEPNANVTVGSPSPRKERTDSPVFCTNEDNKDTDNTAGEKSGGPNGNNETRTTSNTISDSMTISSSVAASDTVTSSPNSRTSSPIHTIDVTAANNGNESPNNINGIVKKKALKAALSLDASELCRGTVPYKKIAFTSPKTRLSSNPGSTELRKDSQTLEFPREEKCSC